MDLKKKLELIGVGFRANLNSQILDLNIGYSHNIIIKLPKSITYFEVANLKERLRDVEQYTRRNNLDISGIPVTPQENVFNIVKDVGMVLGVEVKEEQVAAAHRIPSFKKDQTPSLIVQFHGRATRDTLLSKFREKKTLSTHEVNASFSQQRVYLNEHLSPDNKVFLAKLKQKCREVGYTYVWCRGGKFFIRKNSGEKSIKISSYGEMERIK